MEEEVQLRSVFMASWAILTHCLYCKRVQSRDSAAPATNGYLAAAQGRAADAVIAAWKRELRCLLWAYARVDLDKPCETNGIASWRATFALRDWYDDPPDSADPYNKVVAIAFPPLEGDAVVEESPDDDYNSAA